MIDATEQYEINISNSNMNLNNGELELLYSIVSGIKYSAIFMNENNNSNLPSIVMAQCGIPCGAAIVGYQAGFIGLCMSTGPIGWIVGGIGFGMGVWGVFDSCD